jgi:galactose mutarotase-like enzyme
MSPRLARRVQSALRQDGWVDSASSGPTVELRSGELSAVVEGGAHLTVASLIHRNRELLIRPGEIPEAYRVHGSRAGITLLHPWANRLGPGRIAVDGRPLVFEPDDPTVARDERGLPIHGLALDDGWRVAPTSGHGCRVLGAARAVPGFPFAHRVDVTIELGGGSRLTIETTVTAAEDAAIPVAFGWHPYFHIIRSPAAELMLPRRRRLVLDALGVPAGSNGVEDPGRFQIGERSLDDGFGEIGDGAQFGWTDADGTVVLTHEHGFPNAQVFAPADAPVLSLEPMTGPTDSLRTGEGLRFATRQAPFSARFSIELAT